MRAPPLLLVLAFPVLAVAQTQGDQDPVNVEELLPAPREVFRVGFAELAASSLPPERRFISAIFPLLLYEELRTIDARLLSEEEQNAYLAARLESARIAAARDLTAAVDSRDALLFSLQATEEQRLAAGEAVRLARLRFEAAESANLIATGQVQRPLEFLDDLESGLLLSPVTFTGRSPVEETLLALADEHDLDYVVFGLAAEQAGYTIVDIFGYHRFLESIELLSTTTRLAEEVGRDARPVADEMAQSLLGRGWGEFVVVTQRDDAAIRVDGALAGFGTASIRYAEPGTYSVSATVPGFQPATGEVSVTPGGSEEVSLQFVRSAGRGITLRSSPIGADVYVDSLWVGQTPMVHTFPTGSSVVHLRREGFLESRFVVDSQTPAVVSRALLSDQIDWTVELREQRDEFYGALGYFVVSVPVTVLLWGGYQNVLGTRASPNLPLLPPEDDAQLVQLGNTLYWSALGGIAVNIGLFVNVVINLLDYVAVGEGAHNQ